MKTSDVKGFTLIEVVVAISLLAVISLFTVNALTRALQTKRKIQGQIDKTSTLRDALRVMERDINMAFHYKDINTELYNQAQTERKKAAEAKKNPQLDSKKPAPLPGQPGYQPPQGLDANEVAQYKLKPVKEWTKFIGTKDELNFTSLSNVRMTEDQPMSSQAEIGYHIKPCRRRSTQEQASRCLWRRVSNYIHEDITKYGTETVLLENVTVFSLRYLGPDKDDEWVEAWASDETGDDTTKGKFPYAVEITIEVKDPSPKAKDKTLRMTTVASIRNPNNPPPKVDPNTIPGGDANGTTPTPTQSP